MTTGTTKTQGTRLFFALSESEIHKVSCPTGISGLGGAATRIDQTCLDTPEEMEYVQGLKDPGEVSVPVNFISRSAAFQAMEALYDSGDVVPWMIVESNQAGSPVALDSDGYLVSPGPTTKGFMGYIANLEGTYEPNSIVRGTFTIQRSGAIQRDNPTADLA